MFVDQLRAPDGKLERFKKTVVFRSISEVLDTESVLRAHDLRGTRQRVAALDAIRENPHADTNSVIERVRERIGEVSYQAIYDVLRDLTEAGRRVVVRHPRIWSGASPHPRDEVR